LFTLDGFDFDLIGLLASLKGLIDALKSFEDSLRLTLESSASRWYLLLLEPGMFAAGLDALLVTWLAVSIWSFCF
jgi:hypothetical protein